MSLRAASVAILMSVSVTQLIAETTTAVTLASLCGLRITAMIFSIASAEPIDVPPNLRTLIDLTVERYQAQNPLSKPKYRPYTPRRSFAHPLPYARCMKRYTKEETYRQRSIRI